MGIPVSIPNTPLSVTDQELTDAEELLEQTLQAQSNGTTGGSLQPNLAPIKIYTGFPNTPTKVLQLKTVVDQEMLRALSLAVVKKIAGTRVTPVAETPSGLVNSINVTYTLSEVPRASDEVLIFLNGLSQRNGTDFSVVGTTVTFVTAPVTGTEIFAVYNTSQASITPYFGDNFVWVASKDDLPPASGGIITLAADTTYFFLNSVDLTGDRIVCVGINAILGSSSETAFLTSTGLSASDPLIYSEYSLPMQNISITADYAVEIQGDSNTALDWKAVNFVDCAKVGIINSTNNCIITDSAFINSADLSFDGTIGTVGMDGCLFIGTAATPVFSFTNTLIITRRIRIHSSSFVIPATGVGIDVSISATIPTESYILDTVNFSGSGTYLTGVTHTSNTSLFILCKSITNTAVNGQLYMLTNATATTVSNTTDFFKVAGTTTPSSDNQKFAHSNNRLTCEAIIERRFLVQATLSFATSANNVCEFGFYDSNLAGIRAPSRTKATANSSGRLENVTLMCIANMSLNDYIEVHCRNTSGANNITVEDMNLVITEIN